MWKTKMSSLSLLLQAGSLIYDFRWEKTKDNYQSNENRHK